VQHPLSVLGISNFSSQNDLKTLKSLADFSIKYHFPEIKATNKESYIQFFREVASKTREMVVHWQRVGFVHGVMNTDNMSILGLTIDYGPYGWLEDYNPNWTPNTTDQGKPQVSFWEPTRNCTLEPLSIGQFFVPTN
jgi:uncharacterized protein YdiU (UPF0061 family)